ncbi:MAG: outer membrane beta-barrel protein [Candidatus Sphingomonas colombiensis]|nr:outer membrane beta-barrel protein [Sphingomonas sp.]WEK44110.1 MAG: outer membrane beta-barrel protein [Sphingomonas sp.]
MKAVVRIPGARGIRAGAAVLGAATALVVAGSAAAQAVDPTQEGIHVNAGLDIGYDSNVARSAGAILTNGRQADERATPSLNVSINKSLGRNSLTLDANGGYDFYRRNSELNRERLGFNADLALVGGPCFLNLRPSIFRSQSDLGDIVPINIPGQRSVRNTATTQSYAGELQCGDSYGLRPLITVAHTAGNNSEELRRISNYRSNTYGAGVAYGDPTYGELSLRVTRQDTSYPDRPAIFGPGDFSTKRISLDAQRSIGSMLSGSVGLSYVMVRPDQGSTSNDFNGFGWNVGLTFVPSPNLRVNAGTSRNISPSLGTDSLYQVNRDYSLGADYAFSDRLKANVGGSIGKVRYDGSGGVFGPVLTSSLAHRLTASLSFIPSRRLTYTLYGGYQDRETNNAIYNYHSYFIGLRTSFAL